MSFQEVSSEEAKEDILNFLGLTYGELAKIDKNIVSSTSQTGLSPTSHALRQQIINIAENPSKRHEQQANSRRINLDIPSATPLLANSNESLNDPNQLEFSFDNSATAVSIQKQLDKVSDDLRKIMNKLNKLVDIIETE